MTRKGKLITNRGEFTYIHQTSDVLPLFKLSYGVGHERNRQEISGSQRNFETNDVLCLDGVHEKLVLGLARGIFRDQFSLSWVP